MPAFGSPTASQVDIELHCDRIAQAQLIEEAEMRSASICEPPDANPEPDAKGESQVIRLTVAAELRRAGKELKFVIEGAERRLRLCITNAGSRLGGSRGRSRNRNSDELACRPPSANAGARRRFRRHSQTTA